MPGAVIPGRLASPGLRLREAIAHTMRMLYERGLINPHGGNASGLLVLPDGTAFIYITPGGALKPAMDPMDVAVMGLDGYVYWGRPSSEHRLHLAVYKAIEEARAVVHAHNPAAVQAARLGLQLDPALLGYEARYYLGSCVSRVPAHEPGTWELARAAARALAECPVAVMEKHGAVAVGYNRDPVRALYEALDKLTVLEDLARAAMLEARGGAEHDQEKR